MAATLVKGVCALEFLWKKNKPLANLASTALGSWVGASRRTAIRLGALAIALGLTLGSCQPRSLPEARVAATVQQIISGHTLEVIVPSLANNQLRRVRLIGLDAPNPAQRPWGVQAMDYLRQVDKQAIELEFDVEQQDDYGRLLAYVWYQGKLLNQDLVAQGHALRDAALPNTRYEVQLKRAQESARLQGLGIWNPANPMHQTPDEFREQLP